MTLLHLDKYGFSSFYSFFFFLMHLQGTVIQGCFFFSVAFLTTGIDLKQILIPPADLPVETASRSCSGSSVLAEAALSKGLIYQSCGLTRSRRAQHRSGRGQEDFLLIATHTGEHDL